jgi:hypothetical protein
VQALASNMSPLMRHARVVSERPVAERRMVDDVDDAIDDDDCAVESDEPLEHEQEADDDEPSAAEHTEAAAMFDHSSWTVFGAAGVDPLFPDKPLDAARSRGVGDFGIEVAPFARSSYIGANKNAIKNAYPADAPQGCTSTMQFVRLLFTDAMIEKLCTATNAAAEGHPRCKNLVRIQRAWKPLTASRLWLWFAIATYLGVVKVQNRKSAWSKKSIFRQKWISGQMGQQEFENILTCLNCCEHWTLSNEEFQGRQKQNVFWQMDELLQECNSSSQAYFRLGHRIDVDEAVIPWKGKHKARCYNSKKPHKFHFKKFMLNDAASGYNYNFYYYGGKEEERPADIPATTWPVVKLLSTTDINLENKNHIVALDNWFTSSRTHAWLASKGFVAVGTVGPKKLHAQTATRSVGFPKNGIFKKSATRAKGAYVVHRGRLLLDAGQSADCYVTAWQDRSPVHILSTYPPTHRFCTRKVKLDGNFVQAEWPQPSVVHHYNISMKGTDLHDQRVAAFRTVVKSQRWQVRIITDLFTSMLQNAFVLYKQYHNKDSQYDSRIFIESVLQELANITSMTKNDHASKSDDSDDAFAEPRRAHRRDWWVKGPGAVKRLNGRDHWPQHATNTCFTENADTHTKIDLRRYCMFHRDCGRVLTYCTKCNVPLCLAHFELFHTLPGDAFPPCERE